jgi:hypothetical protein
MKNSRRIPNEDVAERYGVGVRTIDNWLADDELGFPRPIVINTRKYYLEDELDEFDRRATFRGSASAPKAA